MNVASRFQLRFVAVDGLLDGRHVLRADRGWAGLARPAATSSAPTSNSRAESAPTGPSAPSGRGSHRAKPSRAFNSSKVPQTSSSAASLGTRTPPSRSVSPWSPVRV